MSRAKISSIISPVITSPMWGTISPTYGVGGLLSYVKSGRVLDLGDLDFSTVPDLSVENNNATMYTGLYADLAVDDYIQIDTPGFARTPASIAVKARSASATSVPIDWGGLTLSGSITANNLWQAATASVSADVLANLDKMWFDGVNDYISLGDPANLSFGNATTDSPFSISARFLFTGIALPIVSKYRDVGAGDGEYLLNVGADGTASLVLIDNEVNVRIGVSFNTNIQPNTAYHIVVTYDGGGSNSGIKLYLNDVEVTSKTLTGAGAYVAMHNTTTPVIVGAQLLNFATPQYGKGSVWDVAVFDKELTASEVSQEQAGTLGDANTITRFLGYGNTNADWLDPIGGNNGTVNGSPQTVEQLLRNPASITIGEATVVDLSNLQIRDSAGAEIDAFWLADKVGQYADGDMCMSRGGVVGQYKGAPVGGSGEGVPQDVVRFDGLDDLKWLQHFNFVSTNESFDWGSAWEVSFVYMPNVLGGRFFTSEDNASYTIATSGVTHFFVAIGDYIDGNTEANFDNVGIPVFGTKVTVTFDGATTARLYYNDVLVSSKTISSPIPAVSSSLRINGRPSGGGGVLHVDYFEGTMRDVVIQDSTRTRTWDGTLAGISANGWSNRGDATVSSVIGPQRETILQTGGVNFNRGGNFGTPFYESNFGVTTLGLSVVRASYSGNKDGVGGVDDALLAWPNSDDSSHFLDYVDGSNITDKWVKVTLDYYVPSTNPNVDGFVVGFASPATGGLQTQIYSPTKDVWGSVTLVGRASAGSGNNRLRISFASGGSTAFSGSGTSSDGIYFKNIVLQPAYPETVLVPESSTTGIDALDNPLDFQRPNNRVFNGAATGAYLLVADSATRNSLNVFAGWIFYDGVNRVWADYSNGAGTKVIEIVGGAIDATDFAGSDVFVGNKTAEMANTNTLSAGWNYVFIPFTDYTPTTYTRFYGRTGHLIEYIETKTLAQAEQNRKATKGEY